MHIDNGNSCKWNSTELRTFIKLTKVDTNLSVYVDISEVSVFDEDVYTRSGQKTKYTRLYFQQGNFSFNVKETPEEIFAFLNPQKGEKENASKQNES